ncbi:D-alanine--D-alanine ligase [Flavobacteriaceae bacterium]|nr:D-alanine--D-alanine ligase [Flavobacteriaceae bacterium]
MKKNIAIIMGGFSSEAAISLKSGQVVFQHLPKEVYAAYCIHISKEKWVYVAPNDKEYPIHTSDFSVAINGETVHFDCVFNAIHGAPGEDGFIQAYLELLEIPHTSCALYQAALTFNKRDCLNVLKAYDIPTAISYPLNKGDSVNAQEIIDRVGLPCFVKANRAGSSFGVTKVHKIEDLQSAIDIAFEQDDELIIEAFLDGTEVSVGVLRYKGEVLVLPITEIVSENDFFDYEAKYLGKSEEITPARISKVQEENVKHMAKKIYEVLNMDGFSRSEFIFKGDTPYFLEMNTVPGLTEESILPKQAACAGISLSDLFTNAIEEALAKND